MTNAKEYGIDLSEPELLAGLAEEASELAQAALKLRRVLDGANPTPVSEEDAREALQGEIDDVLNYLAVLDLNGRAGKCLRKLTRWRERLEARGNGS